MSDIEKRMTEIEARTKELDAIGTAITDEQCQECAELEEEYRSLEAALERQSAELEKRRQSAANRRKIVLSKAAARKSRVVGGS